MPTVYGLEPEIRTKRALDLICPYCKTKGQTDIAKSTKTFHIWFIPIFPIKVERWIHCIGCNAYAKYGDMNPEVKTFYSPYKPNKFGPWWHYLGIYLALGLIIFLSLPDFSKQKEIIERLEKLEINRVLDLQLGPERFSSVKVLAKDGEDVTIVYNAYEASTEGGIDKINSQKNFTGDTVQVSKSSINEWYQEGKLLDIHW
ncbi:MAG: zinc-ribbon domain-containing protein [Bacteroidota bacterium]